MNHIPKKYLAEFVYGATDGTVTTFAIISGIMGAGISPLIVLVLGVANVLADGFSMASSNYLSEKSNCAVGNDSGKKPIKTAVITFFSFVVVGLVPILPFLGKAIFEDAFYDEFSVSIILTAFAFLVIGFIRGVVASKNRIKSSIETLLIGGVAAAIAYFVGFFLEKFLGAF